MDPDRLISDRVWLRHRLEARNREPDRAEAIDAEIRATLERTAAILVLDMAGFERSSAERGILACLARIAAMDAITRPIVRAHGGVVLKQEADNLFALFENPTQALRAAVVTLEAFAARNAQVAADQRIEGCFGLGFGPLLVVDQADVFGCEMNLACKLGEDHARAGEILLTASAYAALEPISLPFFLEPAQRRMGEALVDCHRYLHGPGD